MKSGTASTTSGPGDSTTYNNVGPDAMGDDEQGTGGLRHEEH